MAVPAAKVDVLAAMAEAGHGEVGFHHDPGSGLRAIVAIYDVALQPALAGCRMWPYRSEGEAVGDALRLAQGLTWKAAAAGLDYGGAQVVVVGNPETEKTPWLLRALGQCLHRMQGRVLMGEDVGTTAADLVEVSRETPYVVGLPVAYGGSGDTAEHTARGVIQAMRAALMHRYGNAQLRGRRVAVQGLGKVGYAVARAAKRLGAEVLAADINPQRVGRVGAELGVEPVDPWAILEVEADVLAPCALGGVLTARAVPRLGCRIIAGSANNQLADPEVARLLAERDILYAPDFVANAGGLIQVADEREPGGYSAERVRQRVDGIYDTLVRIFAEATRSGRSTWEVATEAAEQRLTMLRRLREGRPGWPVG